MMHNVAPPSSPDLERAFGGMAEKAGSMAEQQMQHVTPALVHAAERSGAWLDRRAHAVHDAQRELRERALRATDRTAGYIRHEPFKAVLFAAAGGALLMMALAGLVTRRHH